MRILRIVPFPPEYIGGLPYYCRNLSINLAKLKNVETDILTANLLGKEKKISFVSK